MADDEKEKDYIDSAADFIEMVRNNLSVKLKFTKADGTVRIMKCTLNFSLIPKIDQPKELNLPKILKLIKNNKIIHVYDLEKQGWRSVPYDRTEWIENVESKRFKIRR